MRESSARDRSHSENPNRRRHTRVGDTAGLRPPRGARNRYSWVATSSGDKRTRQLLQSAEPSVMGSTLRRPRTQSLRADWLNSSRCCISEGLVANRRCRASQPRDPLTMRCDDQSVPGPPDGRNAEGLGRGAIWERSDFLATGFDCADRHHPSGKPTGESMTSSGVCQSCPERALGLSESAIVPRCPIVVTIPNMP